MDALPSFYLSLFTNADKADWARRARHEIEQIDAVIGTLDKLREDAGMSKAELARRAGRNPASIRRLFTAERVRPELPLIISIANALDASIEIKPAQADRMASSTSKMP